MTSLPWPASSTDEIEHVVDEIAVVALAAEQDIVAAQADQDVVAAFAVERVGARIAEELVAELVAGEVERGRAAPIDRRQDLDLAPRRERVARRGEHQVSGPLAGQLDHLIAGIVDDIDVVADAAGQRVRRGRAEQQIVGVQAVYGDRRGRGAAAGQSILEAVARRRVRRPR